MLHLKEEHQEKLFAALEHSSTLGGVVLKKKWTKAAAPHIAELAAKRSRCLTSGMLGIWLRHFGEGDVDDLLWHFSRLNTGFSSIMHRVKSIEGFPYKEAVEDLWRRRQAGLNSGSDLVPFAAAEGVEGAMEAFGIQLRNKKWKKDLRVHYLKIVQPVVPVDGSLDDVEEWIMNQVGEIAAK